MRLYLLRHGEVTSHRGDVPITPDAEHHAFVAGGALAEREPGPVLVLSGETRRAVDTATHLVRGMAGAGCMVLGPRVAFALRNPDLYLAGTRVNMVSSPESLADQVDGFATTDVERVDFFPDFLASGDRIGWWLVHHSPPGDTAAAVAARVRAFARSLTDPLPGRPEAVVAVTHSPLLRAAARDMLGRDLGEPRWLSGLLVDIRDDANMSAEIFAMEPT